MDLCGSGSRNSFAAESMVCTGAGRFFPGISYSVSDWLDSIPYAGHWSRGYKTVFRDWLPERRRGCFLLHLFFFPAGRRNLSQQAAESQTTQGKSDELFSIFYKYADTEKNIYVSWGKGEITYNTFFRSHFSGIYCMVGGESVQNRVIAIAIGGFENAYMRKFALYLSKRMGERVQIGIVDHMERLYEWDPGTLWIGSSAFISQIREQMDHPRCIILSEEESAQEDVICRYQSCEKIYQRVVFFCGETGSRISSGKSQKWIVITSDSTISHLLAVSVTAAYLLAGKGEVLYMNLSECSGMEELFLMGEGTDLSDFVLELRSDKIVSVDAFTRRLEKINCILPPENPMVLHEMRRKDMEMTLEIIRNETQYEYVVVMMGCTCCGCELLFQQASAVFHLTREGETFKESQQAWLGMIRKCLDGQTISVMQLRLPMVQADSQGAHLIYEWAEGPLGQLIEKYLDGQEGQK